MNTKFVKATIDINCDWTGTEPGYRVYVNDELFTERVWRWHDCYIQEMLQIQAAPGSYTIRLEPVNAQQARFHVSNPQVENGPARWIDNETLSIEQ